MNRRTVVAVAFASLSVLAEPTRGVTQGAAPRPPAGRPQRGRGGGGGQRSGVPWRTADDTARAQRLYISIHPEDLPRTYGGSAARLVTDSIFAARSKGVMDFQVVSYKSDIDGLEIPAYVFAPLIKRGARGHAAMVWVHGYVHGRFQERALPFVKEAVARGYVIVAPQYRCSLGYLTEFDAMFTSGGKADRDADSSSRFGRSAS